MFLVHANSTTVRIQFVIVTGAYMIRICIAFLIGFALAHSARGETGADDECARATIVISNGGSLRVSSDRNAKPLTDANPALSVVDDKIVVRDDNGVDLGGQPKDGAINISGGKIEVAGNVQIGTIQSGVADARSKRICGRNRQRKITCLDQQDLSLSGNGNHWRVIGRCSDVRIDGQHNQVWVDHADDVTVYDQHNQIKIGHAGELNLFADDSVIEALRIDDITNFGDRNQITWQHQRSGKRKPDRDDLGDDNRWQRMGRRTALLDWTEANFIATQSAEP